MPCSFGVIGYSRASLHDAQRRCTPSSKPSGARASARTVPVDLERRLLRQVVGALEDVSGATSFTNTTHWMVPVPSRTWRKCSLPLERRL